MTALLHFVAPWLVLVEHDPFGHLVCIKAGEQFFDGATESKR